MLLSGLTDVTNIYLIHENECRLYSCAKYTFFFLERNFQFKSASLQRLTFLFGEQSW
jgi:hypothetical protein